NFFFYYSAAPRYLHSFPTRRSSDLVRAIHQEVVRQAAFEIRVAHDVDARLRIPARRFVDDAGPDDLALHRPRERGRQLLAPARRSEEHTSELQSRSDLVCRLLLEKK